MDANAPPVRDAATVVLLRDGPHGMELLLTVRPRSLRFMGGAVVFPGGGVAGADLDPSWAGASVLAAGECGDRLEEDPRLALGLHITAMRETFEEVGWIAGENVDALPRATADNPADFLRQCKASDVVLATDRLIPAGRWITPLGAPVRFDARFFLARVEPDWDATPDPSEVESCRWATPTQALGELAAGHSIMAPPTVEMLQRLEPFTAVDQALATIHTHETTKPGILRTRLSPLVRVVLAPNPSPLTGPGTNTYIVGAGPSCVVDPAVDDAAFIDAILGSTDMEAIVITHRHSDHIGGVRALLAHKDVPVYAHGDQPVDGVPPDPIDDGHELSFGGARLRALHTPGHASDHVCFYMEGAASLFAGDNVLGEGTAVIAPPDGNMKDYLSSLERLLTLDIDRIYPGHWRPLDGGRAVIEGYLEHRRSRGQAILEALVSGPKTVPEIVALVYTDTPSQLHPIAEFQVLSQLELMTDRHEVVLKDDHWAIKGVE